jgi:tetratricopeptide (TPR) repeat protein
MEEDPALTEGLALRAEGRLIDALDALSRVHRRTPSALTAYWTAVTYDNLGAEVLAIPLYRESLARGLDEPLRAHARAYLASSLTKTGSPGEAAPLIAEALTEAPAVADFWEIAGRVHRALGAIEEARSAFERAVVLDAEHPRAWHGLADTRARLGDVAGAEAAFRRAWAHGYFGD